MARPKGLLEREPAVPPPERPKQGRLEQVSAAQRRLADGQVRMRALQRRGRSAALRRRWLGALRLPERRALQRAALQQPARQGAWPQWLEFAAARKQWAQPGEAEERSCEGRVWLLQARPLPEARELSDAPRRARLRRALRERQVPELALRRGAPWRRLPAPSFAGWPSAHRPVWRRETDRSWVWAQLRHGQRRMRRICHAADMRAHGQPRHTQASWSAFSSR